MPGFCFERQVGLTPIGQLPTNGVAVCPEYTLCALYTLLCVVHRVGMDRTGIPIEINVPQWTFGPGTNVLALTECLIIL